MYLYAIHICPTISQGIIWLGGKGKLIFISPFIRVLLGETVTIYILNIYTVGVLASVLQAASTRGHRSPALASGCKLASIDYLKVYIRLTI